MDPEQITGANRLGDFKRPDDFCVGFGALHVKAQPHPPNVQMYHHTLWQ